MYLERPLERVAFLFWLIRDVDQRGVNHLLLRTALMPVKFGLHLGLGQIGVVQVFLTGAKREHAHITISHTGSDSDKPGNLEVALRHG